MSENDETQDPEQIRARSRRSGVQSIEIGGALLEAIVTLGAPGSLSEISRTAGMPTAKAHRYLTSFCEIGLTMQHQDTGRYGLGPLALRMGLSAIAQHDIIERAFEVLRDLCVALKTSGHLSVWSEAGPVVIRSAHGGPPVISPIAVGTILPLLRSATGLIYLSFLPDTAVSDLVDGQSMPAQIDESELARRCHSVAERRYAVVSGDYIPGLCAIALPIQNHDQSLAGAITLVSTDMSVFQEDSEATQRAVDAVAAFHRAWSLPTSAL